LLFTLPDDISPLDKNVVTGFVTMGRNLLYHVALKPRVASGERPFFVDHGMSFCVGTVLKFKKLKK